MRLMAAGLALGADQMLASGAHALESLWHVFAADRNRRLPVTASETLLAVADGPVVAARAAAQVKSSSGSQSTPTVSSSRVR